MKSQQTVYQLLGGEIAVRAVVETFYPKVQKHPLLSPLFPADIQPVMDKQFQFMTQLFGGPPLYSEKYGHPMMRARHLAFPIDQSIADAWLACMQETLQEVVVDETIRSHLMERFKGMAYHFMNK